MDNETGETGSVSVSAGNGSDSESLPHWFDRDFGGAPIIYSITMHHLYGVILIGRVCHIVLYIVGGVGNLISLRIWTLPRMRRLNRSAPYLISITACDLLYQMLHVFFYLKYFWGLPSLGLVGLCKIWNVLNIVPQYASQLLIFGYTCERLIAIFWPFNSERFRRKHRVPICIVFIFGMVLLLACPQFAFWGLNVAGFCEIRDDADVVLLYGYWSLVSESLIFLFIPFTTLIFNIFVLRYALKTLRGMERMSVEMTASKCMRVHKRSHSETPATRTLLCISFFRILSQLPVSITYTLQNLDSLNFGRMMPLSQMSFDPQWQRFLCYWTVRMLIETVGASHYAFGIFIYSVSTRQFKKEVYQMLGLGPQKPRRRWNRRLASTSRSYASEYRSKSHHTAMSSL